MMQPLKRLIAALMALVLICTAVPFPAYAAKDNYTSDSPITFGSKVSKDEEQISNYAIGGLENIVIYVGDTITLTGTSNVRPDCTYGHEWKSSKTSVATVSGSGNTATVIGRSAGTVTIKHKYCKEDESNHDKHDRKTEECTVTVLARPSLKSLSIGGGNTVFVGGTLTLTAVPNPDGAPVDPEWSSSAPDVLTVDEKTGMVTGVAAGEATVTLTDKTTGKTATLRVTVTEPVALESVTIEGDREMTAFTEINLTAVLNPEDADITSMSWQSLNAEVLTVDETGKVYGVQPGEGTIQLTVNCADGTTKTAEHKITVKETTESTHEADFYYLKTPTSDPASNSVDQWGETLGAGTINITGATWVNNKNCFNPAGRIISWPASTNGNVVPRGSSHWNVIYEAFKETVSGITSPDDVEAIILHPYKISNNERYHVDCTVEIKAKTISTATYYLWDAGDTGYIWKAAQNHRNGEETSPFGPVQNLPDTKTVNGVTYTFDGWYTNANRTGTKVVFPYTMAKENVNFYAKYIAGYQVNYDLAGGSWGIQSTYNKNEGTTVQIVSTTPTRTGYNFIGWTSEDLTTPEIQAGSFIMPGHNVTLTAQWERNVFDVTYSYTGTVPTGASELPATTSHNYGAEVTVAPAATAPGYTFSGWTTNDVIVNDGKFTMPDKDVAFTGSWTEDANVIISYEATTGGSVSRESESLAPATGVAQGSTATAAAGYHFVNWTNAAGDEVSTSLTYVPAKVDGLNVAATYTANFAKSTFAYTVNYILLDRNHKEVTRTTDSEQSGLFGDPIPYDKTTRTHDGEEYVFLEVKPEDAKITEVAENNVLNVYFGIDTIGIDPVNPDAPDKIPDEKQIMFEYRAETGGTVSKAKEVITKDAEGKATPTGATAIPGDLYLFSEWKNGDEMDNTPSMNTFKTQAYTSDQTFTAYFIEKVASLSVRKTSRIDRDTICTVGDEIGYTIIVRNTGNIDLKNIVVTDPLTKGSWPIDELGAGEYADPITTAYKVTLDDVLAATETKNQLVNTAYAKAPNPLYGQDAETTTTPQPEELIASYSVQNTLAYRNLAIEKTVLNRKEVYDFGDVIQYKIKVTNNGTYSEPAGLTIVDQLKNATGNVTGPGWNNGVYTLPPIAPNGFVEVYCSYTVPEADAGRVIFNKAAVISGTATQATDETDGEKIMPLYNLAIVYVDANTGYALAETYLAKLKAGTPFYVVSPVIEGYTTQVLAVKSDADGMPAHDLSIAVVYTPIAPEEEPEEEPKEPEVNVVTPTEDGGYDLTPISELDTPLADMDLGDHTCCIMHFLLMLASLITLAFYTDSRKKHQARIHQLKQSMKAEGKDDPSEKM